MVWINVQDKQAPTCEVDAKKYAYCDGVPYKNYQNKSTSETYSSGMDLNCSGANGIYDTSYFRNDKYDKGEKVNPFSII
jgi:hypothetical protein